MNESYLLLLTKVPFGNRVVNLESTVQVVDLFSESQRLLGHVDVLPVVQDHLSHIFQFVVVGKIDDFPDFESDVVFIDQEEYLLLVIHNNQALTTALFNIICHQFTVGLKSHQSASRQLEYFLLGDLVRLGCMELQLLDLVYVSLTFGVENFLVVASDEVSTDHVFWFANDFENVFVD